MFAQLEPLIPQHGVIHLTLCRSTAQGKVRLTVHPLIPDARVDEDIKLKPIVFEDVDPAELDAPDISFAPVLEARKSVQESIAAAAEQLKKDAEAKKAAQVTKETTPSGVKETTTKPGGKSQTKYKAPPAVPSAAAAPDADAEKAKQEAEAKATADAAAAEAKAKDEAEKNKSTEEIAKLRNDLVAAEQELGFKF